MNMLPGFPRGQANNRIIIGLIAALAVAAGGYLAYRQFTKPTPEQIVYNATKQLASVKTFAFTSSVHIETEPGGAGNPSSPTSQITQSLSSVDLALDGATDLSDLASASTQTKIKATLSDKSGNAIVAGLEVRRAGNHTYLQLTDAPNLGIIDLSPFKNRWVLADSGTEALSPLGRQKATAKQLTPEETAKLKTAFYESRIFIITKTIAGENLSGVSTTHYQFILNKPGLKSFLVQSATILSGKAPTDADLKKTDKDLEGLDLANGEIWIGDADSRPYKVSADVSFKASDPSQQSGKAKIIISLKNFDQPITVETPKDATSLDELMGGIIGGMMGGEGAPIMPGKGGKGMMRTKGYVPPAYIPGSGPNPKL